MFSVQGDLLFYALHFNAPGEIEAISPESCRFRTDEYALFHDPGFRDWLAERPFEVIGMRAMRDGLRAAWGQERRAVQ
jgi:hypothetical protein